MVYEVKKEEDRDVITLSPQGDIDQDRGKVLFKEIIDLLEKGQKKILLDFVEVTAVHSTGLGYLILAAQKSEKLNAQICLCRVPDAIVQLMAFTSVDSYLKIYPDRESVAWE